LENQIQIPDFWNDQNKAKKITQELNAIKEQLNEDSELKAIADDFQTYLVLLEEQFSDSLFLEGVEELQRNIQKIDKIETLFLLNGKSDQNDAILSIHPGAGGTESQDWAEMLMRMYLRWVENAGLKSETIDLLPGDEAGIKSVTLEIVGENAFGLLKGESGVHRLVRISPFNAQGKRQTSFASVFVYPILDDDTEIDIDPKELRVDTYRSSGKGGQGVNTTDSAVRITHLPTGIVVQCQNERSQIVNREVAMRILKSRLFQMKEEQREKERQKLEDNKTGISWGNQIRSYVFHPYQMIKDHRTGHETGNVDSVMNGNLDDFIASYLKFSALRNK
jgi:peptide chain release factor 2